ncbi:N-acyl homoserine lactonase family protein [Nocardiopsis coralliicola]
MERDHGGRSKPDLEVLAVRYGELTTAKSALFHDFAAYGEPDAAAAMHYFFWIVRGAGATLLVDTGFTPEAARRRGRTCLVPPVDAARAAGVAPESAPTIVLTHFHYDHIGNLAAFPHSPVLAAEREYLYWTGPSAPACEAVEAAELAHLEEVRREGRLRLLPDRAELMPGVTARTFGGHTPGQLAVVVESARGALILASDAVHLDEEVERDRAFAVHTDLAEMHRSYARLRALSRELGAPVIAGHEPRVSSRHPALDPSARGSVHRLL